MARRTGTSREAVLASQASGHILMSEFSAAMPATDGRRPDGASAPSVFFGRLAIILGLVVYLASLFAAWWGLERYLPDQLHVTLLGHGLTLKEVHRRIVSDGLIFLLLPTVLMIECLVVGWAGSSARQLLLARKASNKTDLAIFVMGQGHLTDLAGRVLTLGASMLTGAWIHNALSAAAGFPLTLVPSSMPMPVQIAAYFAVYSFFDYWTHRLDHTRYFWPLHRYHHSADDFCVVTATRQHPAAFTGIFFINIPLAILGASPAAMIYVNVLVITLGFIIHSRIDSNFGWIGRWIIQSPNHHRLHHVLDISEQPTGHFAMAPVWDRLFGTWRGEADQSLAIGVDTAYRQGFWIVPDLARDYWHFLSGWFVRREV
jgi:sterol desaturase/sphingolipid hydroxylase (fatty acid hydroxylase superfamily)